MSSDEHPIYKPGERVTHNLRGTGTILTNDNPYPYYFVRFDRYPNRQTRIHADNLKLIKGH